MDVVVHVGLHGGCKIPQTCVLDTCTCSCLAAHLYSTSRTALRWLPMSVAVIERWVFNRDANVGHYITSDLSRWL